MNCHIKQKFNYTSRKIELEKLYDNIREKEKNNLLVITNDDMLRCDLKRFGMKNMQHHQVGDVLSREQHAKIKQFRNREDIIVRKADKSNTFVIMNLEDYKNKVSSVLNDERKFKRLNKDPTNDIKKALNVLITSINGKMGAIKISKIVGHFTPGYLYCNPKIHKSVTDPPMRPIISQIGTVTYNIAKTLNTVITRYMPKRYMIQSTQEFIEISKEVRSPKLLASLDVENLFTNVPVKETIDIILSNVYGHCAIPAPDIPRSTLQKLLEICTTQTPFRTPDGAIYQQTDGVSMGSSLGPTMANYYMCHLENRILPTIPNIEQCIYCRYVDDIFLVTPNFKTL